MLVPPAVRLLQRTDRVYGQENDDRPELGRCWEWMGACNHRGYGVIKLPGGRTMTAHRLALETALGRPIRDGMYANHHCDNRRCVRPRHLYEGTPKENVDDMIQRGRWSPPPGAYASEEAVQ